MRIIYIILFTLSLTACSSMVSVDYDKNTHFSSLKTYQINTKPVRISADTRINSPFMLQRVGNTLNNVFSHKGYTRLDNKAELEIKYYLDIKQEVEVQDSGLYFGFGASSHHSALGIGFNVPIGETTSIDNLVLTIDIFSKKINKLIWRGSLGYSLYVGATPEAYSKLVNDLVVEILEEYPPN